MFINIHIIYYYILEDLTTGRLMNEILFNSVEKINIDKYHINKITKINWIKSKLHLILI